MEAGDIDAVLRIEVDAYEFPWPRGVFEGCLNDRHECFVMTRADAVIGYALLSIVADESHLLNVCIAPGEQGRGLGRRFVNFMVERAIVCGVAVIFLEVRPSNDRARALYQSLGFENIGTRKGYYRAHGGREDAQVMALRLLPPIAPGLSPL